MPADPNVGQGSASTQRPGSTMCWTRVDHPDAL